MLLWNGLMMLCTGIGGALVSALVSAVLYQQENQEGRASVRRPKRRQKLSPRFRKKNSQDKEAVKPQQNLSSVSQSAQKISSPRNTSFFPINFTGSHYLPKSVFGFLFSYAINKMASADTLFSVK